MRKVCWLFLCFSILAAEEKPACTFWTIHNGIHESVAFPGEINGTYTLFLIGFGERGWFTEGDTSWLQAFRDLVLPSEGSVVIVPLKAEKGKEEKLIRETLAGESIIIPYQTNSEGLKKIQKEIHSWINFGERLGSPYDFPEGLAFGSPYSFNLKYNCRSFVKRLVQVAKGLG